MENIAKLRNRINKIIDENDKIIEDNMDSDNRCLHENETLDSILFYIDNITMFDDNGNFIDLNIRNNKENENKLK